MTVAELIAALTPYPPGTEVGITQFRGYRVPDGRAVYVNTGAISDVGRQWMLGPTGAPELGPVELRWQEPPRW